MPRSSEANPAPGWWEGIIGPGLALDTNELFVVCVNSLGSAFGSTSPLSINPATGAPYRITFPDLAVEDIARGGFETLQSLGVQRAHTVVGPSLGGMVVLAFAAHVPGRGAQSDQHLRHRRGHPVRHRPALHPARGHPARSGLQGRPLHHRAAAGNRHAHRAQARNDDLPLGRRMGRTLRPHPGDAGHARGDSPFGPEFAVQSYLELHARRFVRAFDPNCYLYLSRAMDRFDLADHGESIPLVLQRSGVERALVIGVESDMLFSIAEQAALAAGLHCRAASTRTTRRSTASRGMTPS